MNKQKIYISSCQLFREGEKNGRKWQLYHVIDPKGVKYGTFESKYVSMVGMEVDVEVKEETVEKNGRTFINKTIIEPKRNDWATRDELRNLEGRIQKLEEYILEQSAKQRKAEIKGEEPPLPDVPF